MPQRRGLPGPNPQRTLATVGEDIDHYIQIKVGQGSIARGLVPDIGVELADRGRVKSGRLTAAVASGTTPPDGDPGQAPGNYATDYPPRFFPVPTRRSLEIKGKHRWGTRYYVTDTTPYAAARAAVDDWVEPSIAAAQARWPATAQKGAAHVKI